MRGAVPQKGLKMKVSINQGSDHADYGFVINIEHCKQLSSLLWDWGGSLPAQIAFQIEFITASPARNMNGLSMINIKVALSGGDRVSWKTRFEHEVLYSNSGGARLSLNNLTDDLLSALKDEIKNHQPVLTELNVMADKLSDLI